MDYPLEIFKALSDQTRFRIICILLNAKEELCECDLADILNLPQYNISKHLTLLDSSNLIKKRKEGRWVYLSISDYLDKFNSEVLNSFSHIPEEINIADIEKMNELVLSKNSERCN